MLGPRQEELLSYLTGLAPVGEEFWLDRKVVRDDLNYRTPHALSSGLRNLKDRRVIRQVGTKSFVVLKRRSALYQRMGG